MRRTMVRCLTLFGVLLLGAAPAWAHDSPLPHVHGAAAPAILAGALVLVTAVARRVGRAGRRDREVR